jgi:Rrf2 family transcriptional regulator, nitric oxide-sensitive transcriptional repressor
VLKSHQVQLSLHADYALRVLVYLATHPGETVSTEQISTSYGISRHHLVRVVRTLGDAGYVDVIPGRSGGMRLRKDPKEIRLGAVVRDAEPNLALVECFDRETNTCPIAPACDLKLWLSQALKAFLADLDRHTLAEMVTAERRKQLQPLFRISLGAPTKP